MVKDITRIQVVYSLFCYLCIRHTNSTEDNSQKNKPITKRSRAMHYIKGYMSKTDNIAICCCIVN